MNDAVPGVFSVFISEGGVRSKVPTPCSTMQLWPRHWVSGPELSWAAYHDHVHGNQTLDESAPLNDWLGQTTLDTNLVRLDYITSWMMLHCFEGISALFTAVALKALHYCEDNDAPIWYWNFNLSSSRGFINVLTFVFHSRLLHISLQFWCKLCRKSSVVYYTLHYTACCTGETKIRFPICSTSDKKLKASGILQHKSLLLYKIKIKPNNQGKMHKFLVTKENVKYIGGSEE